MIEIELGENSLIINPYGVTDYQWTLKYFVNSQETYITGLVHRNIGFVREIISGVEHAIRTYHIDISRYRPREIEIPDGESFFERYFGSGE